ncbi:MAG: lactonase family protein [Lentisphaerae bacterium]|nr:lactonase family protein [Lentisphaerota bacterium]
MKATTIDTVLLAAALAAGTAGAGPERVYVATEASKGIYFAALDGDEGGLSPPLLAAELAAPGFLAIHPNQRFMYATTQMPGGKGGVAALRINDDGTLTSINAQASGGRTPCHVSVDRDGHCLMVANYSGGSVAIMKIMEDGSLAAATVHHHKGSGDDPGRQAGPHPHSITPNPDSTFAYAVDLGIDKVMIYHLDPAEARLTPAGFADVPGGAMGPRHMAWSADGHHAYVLSELKAMMTLFRTGEEPGQLAHEATLGVLPEGTDPSDLYGSEIRIHPNGQFIYAAMRDTTRTGRDTITLFTSATHPEGCHRVATVSAEVRLPRHFTIDPSGKWMLVGGQRSRDVAIFSIDPTVGSLTFTGRKVPFEGGPIGIEFLGDAP